jgi:hypothetical protein
MSEIKFGTLPVPVGSRNALRRVCDAVENEAAAELEQVGTQTGVHDAAEIIREISCGYGYGGYVDEQKIDAHISRLDEYNRVEPQQVDAHEQDALLRLCHLTENVIASDAGKMRSRTVAVKKSEEAYPVSARGEVTKLPAKEFLTRSAFIKDGLDCSVEALRKLSCGIGYESEKPDVSAEVACLRQFQRSIRRT